LKRFALAILVVLFLGSSSPAQDKFAAPGVSPRLISTFFFYDSQHGWATGEDEYPPSVLRTKDAGKTWERVPTPSDHSFYCIRFSSIEIGYALAMEDSSAGLFRTTDGGKTRSRKNTVRVANSLPLDMYLPDEESGWLVGEKGAGEGWVAQFTDKGQNLITRMDVSGLGELQNALAVFGDQQKHIWIVGKELLLHSADKGDHWENQFGNLNKPFDMATGGVALPAGVAWIGSDSGTYQTTDFGLHWTRVNDQRDVDSLSFINIHEGCSVGAQTEVSCSQDGGLTFHNGIGLVPDEHGLQLTSRIQMFADQQGWAELNGVLYKTEDNGRSFAPVLGVNPVIGPKDIPALQVALNGPDSLAYESRTGFLYISQGARIARLDPDRGFIREFAHSLSKSDPHDLAWAKLLVRGSDLWIGDFGGAILRFDETGKLVRMYEPGGPSSSRGQVEGITADRSGKIIFSEGHAVYSFDPQTRLAETLAGLDAGHFTGDGGPAVNAALNFPMGVGVAENGDILIADYQNCRIRKIEHSTKLIRTVAGDGRCDSLGDGGSAREASLDYPAALAIDNSGNIFFTEGGRHKVRRIDPKGIITTIAGTGKAGFSGDGGPAEKAQLNNPSGLAVDPEGNLYISEYVNNRVRRVDAVTGIITTVAGDGYPHRVDVMM
jgi:photosystem II stability/assembly factor-like uncharacterized protein